MTRVLLVTGSRSLATHPGAEAWAREHIRRALEGVSLLIVGDASGPDAWALEEARSAEVAWREYIALEPARAGWVSSRGVPKLTRWSDRAPPQRGDSREEWSAWCHERNAAMAVYAGASARNGHDVRCLALLDGTKRDAPGRRATRGTEHTAALSERAGIVVTREVWG